MMPEVVGEARRAAVVNETHRLHNPHDRSGFVVFETTTMSVPAARSSSREPVRPGLSL